MKGCLSCASGGKPGEAVRFGRCCAVAVALLAGACTSTRTPAPLGTVTFAPQPTQAVSLPGTPGRGSAPVAHRGRRPPALSDAQVRAHFDPSFLAEVGQAGLNEALQEAISPR